MTRFFILESWFQSGLSEGKISLVVSSLGLANSSLLYTNIFILPQFAVTGGLFQGGPGTELRVFWRSHLGGHTSAHASRQTSDRLSVFTVSLIFLFQISEAKGGSKGKEHKETSRGDRVRASELHTGSGAPGTRRTRLC